MIWSLASRLSRLSLTAILLLATAGGSAETAAARNERAAAPEQRVYKTVGDVDLKLYIHLPEDHKPTDKRPAVIFFFGGGWRAGSPSQFNPQARHLASRGMVAMTADYRLMTRHGIKPAECVRDAKSAIRWVRAHAAELGVDPDRIAAGGGSAGGHIAACAGVIKGFEEPGEDAAVSSVPNALLLFNPALDVTTLPMDAGFGETARDLSPALQVGDGAPPTVVFHGKADTLVPYEQAERFEAAMKSKGARCELHGYEGQPHGFFNPRGPNPAPDSPYMQTLETADAFLVSLGWLKPVSNIDGQDEQDNL